MKTARQELDIINAYEETGSLRAAAALCGTGTQLLFRFVAAAYERRALGLASHWPFEQWGRFLPEHVTATSLLDRLLHHATVVVTEGESFRMLEARTRTTRSRS